MNIDTLMILADEWSELGWAVQEQARTFVDHHHAEGLNPNALDLFDGWLKSVLRYAPEMADEVSWIRVALEQRKVDAMREP